MAMGGHQHATPPSVLGLPLQGALDDDMSGVEVEPVARGVVHRHREDEMPAVVAAVGEFVIAGVAAVVPVSDHFGRLERTRVARQEIVEQETVDPSVANGKLASPDEDRPQLPRIDEVHPQIGRRKFSGRYRPVGEAVPSRMEVAGVPDPVPIHAANLEIIGGVVARVHVAVMQDSTTRLLEVAHVPGTRPLGEEDVARIVLRVTPVFVVVESPVTEIQHPVFTVRVVAPSVFCK